jgi:hypothetical protein
MKEHKPKEKEPKLKKLLKDKSSVKKSLLLQLVLTRYTENNLHKE